MRPVLASINLNHLAYNYRLLQHKIGPSRIIAVVKANAYGHGLVEVSKTLFHEGCRHFAVTDAQEGALLYASLPEEMANSASIILLSGIFDADDAQLCAQHHFSPLLSEPTQLQLLQKAGFRGAAWLKTDTGMNRIGTDDLSGFLKLVQQSNIQLAGIMSHLACADAPEHPLNATQIQNFQNIKQNTSAPAYSLLNSAGIIGHPEASADFVRPGIALYGVEPIPTRPLGLKPVMQLSGNIKQIRPLQAGESVSYGATWTAKEDTDVAVIALGYADGLPRLLSNQGQVLHHSGLLPIIGRVCMDYCLVAVQNGQVRPGDEVIFFGFSDGAPLANDVAHQAHTIAYELFTGISSRVPRRYIKENA